MACFLQQCLRAIRIIVDAGVGDRAELCRRHDATGDRACAVIHGFDDRLAVDGLGERQADAGIAERLVFDIEAENADILALEVETVTSGSFLRSATAPGGGRAATWHSFAFSRATRTVGSGVIAKTRVSIFGAPFQ